MNVKPFGWVRILDYYRVNLFLMWKNLIEYKSNFFSSIFSETIYMGGILIFFKIMYDNFDKVIFWTMGDFVLYFITYAVIFTFAGHFFWKDPLFYLIKSGELNMYLIRPINQIFFYLFSKLSSVAFVMLVLYSIFLIIGVIYYNIIFVNMVLGLFFSLLLVFLIVFFYHFIYSLDLALFGLSNIVRTPIDGIRAPLELYPEPFFKKSLIKFFLIGVTPMFFTGSLIIPIFRGYEIWNFKVQVFILFFLIIFFIFGTWFNWNYGLKKYGAVG